MDNKIIILDFGSQYTQLIARRIRELEVYCEVWPFNTDYEKIKQANCKGGDYFIRGPASVYASDAPKIDRALFDLDVPVLGICYGMQLICDLLGGHTKQS